MNNNDELFADLFAYRFMLLDTFGYIGESDVVIEINEREIIKKLKYKMLEYGINYNRINELLHNFYIHYNINITLEEIINARIQIIYIDENNINNLIINYINNYINLNDDINNSNEDNEDNSRLTEEEVNIIPQITIEEELEDSCSICLENIQIGSMVYNIPCNHKFHINCLKPQLINYNRKCPLCRNECFSNIN
jgi:hypothetical protein